MKAIIRMIIVYVMLFLIFGCSAFAFEEIEKGNKGDAVVELQNRLNELGYSVGTVDGDFGNKTDVALRQFQMDNGLQVTGVLDEATYNVLFPDVSVEADVENNPLFLIRGENGYGYCNEKGEVVLSCQWGYASQFVDGLAQVQVSEKGKMGAIDKTGRLVVPCEWNNSYNCSGGYIVMTEGKPSSDIMAVYDLKGTIVLPREEYDWIQIGDEGITYSKKAGNYRYFFYDFASKKTTEYYGLTIGQACGFSEGLWCVSKNSYTDQEFINKKGETVFKIADNLFCGEAFHEGFASVYDSSNKRSGYLDKNGNITIPCKWYKANDFSEGFAAVAIRGEGDIVTFGYIDKTGRLITSLKYKKATSFIRGRALVQSENDLWGFINYQGEEIVNTIYDNASNYLDGGYALVTAGNSMYYIDLDGNPAFSFEEGEPLEELKEKLSATPTPEPTPDLTPEPTLKVIKVNYSESQAQSIAIDYLKAHLKNPASLQVHSTEVTMTTNYNGEYVVVIDYSAMNGFGGYSRDTFLCVIDVGTGEIIGTIG